MGFYYYNYRPNLDFFTLPNSHSPPPCTTSHPHTRHSTYHPHNLHGPYFPTKFNLFLNTTLYFNLVTSQQTNLTTPKFQELLQHNARPCLTYYYNLTNLVNSITKDKNMGSEYNGEEEIIRKPRFLCLHGFRTSGAILKKQVDKWPESVRDKLDLVFVDGPFPAQGQSDVEGIFDPPYFEWFQFNKEFTSYDNFEACLEYIQDCAIKHGPIDGLLGFSQGAILSAALPGLQAQGLALTKVPKIKFLVIIGGAKLRAEEWAKKAYASPIECTSIHFLGKEDFLKPYGEELLKSVVDPFVIHHPRGHTVPRIDDKSLPTMVSFIEKIHKIKSEEANESNVQRQIDCIDTPHA